MSNAIGLVLLDQHWRPVCANDALRTILSSNRPRNGFGADELLQELCSRAAAAAQSGCGTQFNYAGHLCHFTWLSPAHTDAKDRMGAVLLTPASASVPYANSFAQMFRLTKRETEALELYIRGFSAKEVSQNMGISVSTAKAFLRIISMKMGVSGRAEMMSKLMENMCGTSLTCPLACNVKVGQSTTPND